MAMIIPFSKPAQKCWSQSEQSEFLRAVSILRNAGLPIVTEGGLSDEGDPWTVFLREDTGDVVVHICRIEGQVIAASAASPDIVSGASFRVVIDRILKSQPLVLPTAQSSGTLFLHPSAVITAFIATAFSWSCSEEAGLKQYAWSIDKHGQLDPVLSVARGGPHRSILADAIASKSEASSTAEAINAISGRWALAASIAAVALAADLVTKVLPNAPWQDLTTQLSEAAAPESQASTAGGLGLPPFLLADEGDPLAALSQSSQGTIDVADAADLAIASLSSQRDSLSMAHNAMGPVDLLRQGEADPESAHPIPGNPLQPSGVDAPAIIKPAGDGSAPAYSAGGQSGDSVHVGSPAASQLSSSHELLTEAHEFLSYLLGQRMGVTLPVVQDLSMAANALAAGHLNGQVGGVGDAVASSDQSHATQNDGGYKLVDDILTFAFDHSNELSPSMVDWLSFSRGLKSNAFLPQADRVLIIDLPDLQAEAFKFTDGLVMVSQEFAARYLPATSLTPQSQIDVSDGVVLKLIGVIDMASGLHT